MNASELVERYIALRDKKAQMKAEFEEKLKPLDDAMERVEGVLLGLLNQLGADSLAGKSGTAYVSTKTSASVADREAYTGWILAQPAERLIFLDVRANKTAVEHYKDENQELPPGINWSAVRTVNVRRGK